MTNITGENQKRPGDNPWYLLATLYGRPVRADRELQARNRTAWNRYVTRALDDASLALLAKYKQCIADLAAPFTPEEISDIESAFRERHRQEGSSANLALPNASIFKIENIVWLEFSSTDFREFLQYNDYIFPVRVNFAKSSFSTVSFRNAIFLAATFFEGTNFSDSSFDGASFISTASFENATFSSHADFRDTTFSHWTFFQNATFSANTSFQGATFSSWALFESTTFSKGSSFSKTTFCSLISFVNAQIYGPTTFANAVFAHEPPQFFGAKLHEGAVFRNVKWPFPSKDAKNAGIFIDSYERLKLEMDKLKKHGDELDFFVLELKSRRKLVGDWLSRPDAAIAFMLYGLLSDYGRSYSRPLWGLLFTASFGFALLYWHFGMYHFGTSIALGFANTFGALGFRKDFFSSSFIESLPGWLKAVAALQTIIGTILLFLLGLALRNRFRTK